MPLFVRWGPGHLTAIALTVLVPLALAWWARRDASGRGRRVGELSFVSVLLGQAVWRPFWLHSVGRLPDWPELIPLHLCDWALIACVCACLLRTRLACELAYFWGLAGTLQGLLTPDLDYDFPSAPFLLFFLGHGGIVGAVLFLVAGCGFRPTWGSAARAFSAIAGYGVIVGAYNAAAGTNFGYLCAKPDVPTLLDHLGPWPWYIGVLLLVAAVNFALLQAPWAVAARWRAGMRSAGA